MMRGAPRSSRSIFASCSFSSLIFEEAVAAVVAKSTVTAVVSFMFVVLLFCCLFVVAFDVLIL